MNFKVSDDKPPRLLYTIEEVQEMIGVKKSFIYQLVQEGMIPSVRLPSPNSRRGVPSYSIRIPAEALHKWVKQLRGTVNSESPDSKKEGEGQN